MRKIKKGDIVVVTKGKDKNKHGKVLAVLAQAKSANLKVIVEGINLVKKTFKPNPAKETRGGIMEMEKPVDVSNVALLDQNQKPSRVGIRILEDGRKVRFYKTTGEIVDK